MYLDKVIARLEELHIVRPETIIPCTEEEVRSLEHQIGRSLPGAYREFLLWMGHSTGGLLRGSDYRYQDLISLQKWAVELMEEDGFPDPLPGDAFVFLMHQGYEFDFFRIGEGDDPPVYYFLEGEHHGSITNLEGGQHGTITAVHAHFSELLLAIVENSAEIIDYVASLHPEKAKDDPDFARRVVDFEEPPQA